MTNKKRSNFCLWQAFGSLSLLFFKTIFFSSFEPCGRFRDLKKCFWHWAEIFFSKCVFPWMLFWEYMYLFDSNRFRGIYFLYHENLSHLSKDKYCQTVWNVLSNGTKHTLTSYHSSAKIIGNFMMAACFINHKPILSTCCVV